MRKLIFFRRIIFLSTFFFFQGNLHSDRVAEPIQAKHGMVVTAEKLATQVGVEILKKGGNAIDAAVAVGFALAVSYPCAGNIGGGGFMVIHLRNGRNLTIDFREKAPLSASKNMFLNKDGKFNPELSQEGTTSAGVPGTVAGLLYALTKYGTMKLADVIQPAIDLAEKGFFIDNWTANSFEENLKYFKKYSSSFLKFTKDGYPYKEGELFRQPDLARTLYAIKEKGKDGFYKGWVADSLIKKIKSLGGYISQKDLDLYKPIERKPVIGYYRGYQIVSMPPPSSGGIALIELLNILENYKFKKEDWGSSLYFHRLAEAMKYVFADRTFYLGDPDFFKVPEKELLSKKYGYLIFKKIKDKSTPAHEIKHGFFQTFHESKETTHYSIFDSYGNAVSTTTTLNSLYGSKIVVDGAGFLLNNEMDDFSAKPGVPNQFGLYGSKANSIQPQKRMLSSMTPTIVLKNGKPFLIIGSPGGSTIITTVLQVILNCIDFNMNILKAIEMPRIHDQWMPDEIEYEKNSFSTDVKNSLIKMGYKIGKVRTLGDAEGILIDNSNNVIFGASDPRGNGLAEGF